MPRSARRILPQKKEKLIITALPQSVRRRFFHTPEVFMKITQVISDSNVGGAGILVASICETLSHDFDMELILPLGSALTERIDAGRVKLTHLPFAKDRSFDMRDVLRFSSYFSLLLS